MTLRWRAFQEKLRGSLFFAPLFGVLVGLVGAQASLVLDASIHVDFTKLPLGLASTVESARSLLGTLAGATISFAGIAFSVSLLVIQQASSQYSPRIVHTLFRDPFNKRVMSLVVGTFTYCVVVLRSVRTGLEQGGNPVIPNVSLAVAVLLGVATILAVVAFIDHSAHSMDISQILQRVRAEAVDKISRSWDRSEPDGHDEAAEDPIVGLATTVRFRQSGWVQQIDFDRLRQHIPTNSTVRIDTFPGRYAVQGTPLCTVSPPLPTPKGDEADLIGDMVRKSVSLGNTRTMQQDLSYGLRQLADVALRALSPGINDPTTAQDAIFHGAAVLNELLHRQPPSPDRSVDGVRLVTVQQPTHDELVELTYDEVRAAASSSPAVCIYLLQSIALLVETLRADGLDRRVPALLAQAALVTEGAAASSDSLPADIAKVRNAHVKRFGPT
jgi:uncharacterized membrane protein